MRKGLGVCLLCTCFLTDCSSCTVNKKEIYVGKKKVTAVMPSSPISDNSKKELEKTCPQINFSECGNSKTNSAFCTESELKEKVTHLKNALKAQIIWAVRGGHGSYHLIKFLRNLFNDPQNKTLIEKKILIGYSDITVLLLATSIWFGWKNIHGAMLMDCLDANKETNNVLSVTRYLNGVQLPKIDKIKPLNKFAEQSKTIEAELTGGNLTILQLSIGTNWQVNAKNKIILIEDVRELPYKLDRMLTHLDQAGIFEGCLGIIFGEFVCENKSDKRDTALVLQNFADTMPIPVYQTDKFGHGKINLPFAYNTLYELQKHPAGFVLSQK
ncbi:MAG: LD-carboxypeptidase [Holosporales bacterium]|jgi:muramoyltetrapeptide carboxypeptidase|nr:LD-carboxypeptidase [Holosporales bacterium]